MRLRWRKDNNTPPQDDRAASKDRDADVALREAEAALEVAKDQTRKGSLIAQTLAAIREENHFREIWNKGIGS
jgi:hypothetical protein